MRWGDTRNANTGLISTLARKMPAKFSVIGSRGLRCVLSARLAGLQVSGSGGKGDLLPRPRAGRPSAPRSARRQGICTQATAFSVPHASSISPLGLQQHFGVASMSAVPGREKRMNRFPSFIAPVFIRMCQILCTANRSMQAFRTPLSGVLRFNCVSSLAPIPAIAAVLLVLFALHPARPLGH